MPLHVVTPHRRPRSDDEMKDLVASAFGVPQIDAIVELPDPRGRYVQFKVWKVFEHFWYDHSDRWWMAPIARAGVEQAEQLTAKTDGSGDLFYTALVARPGGGAQDYLTYVATDRRGRRYWKSTYPVRVGQRTDREREGRTVWSDRPKSGNRNPAPLLTHLRASRPGRAPRAREQDTSDWPTWPAIAAIIVFGLALADRYGVTA